LYERSRTLARRASSRKENSTAFFLGSLNALDELANPKEGSQFRTGFEDTVPVVAVVASADIALV
jgi:hypothetical protein